MTQKYFISSLVLGAAFFLSACTNEYDRKDIVSYVNDLGWAQKYSVSDTYEEFMGEDGYTDKVWTVVDEEHDITFHVSDDYRWGAESLTNSLESDYEAAVILKYLDQLSDNQLVKDGRIIISAEENYCGLDEVSMEAWYEDRAELQSILEQMAEYKDFFQEIGYEGIDPGVRLRYEGPEDFSCKGHIVGGENWIYFDSDVDQVLREEVQEYLLAGLDYRLEEVMAETTEEERQQAILAEDTYRVGIVREDGQTEYYDDLIANTYGYGLSVSTLYQVLEREGLDPVGDERHYTCIGADGRSYEFSCDFVSELFDDDEGAYYLADGVPVQMGYAYNIHIRAGEASDLFGINIVTEWNKEINQD